MRRTYNDLSRAANVKPEIIRSISGHHTEQMREWYSTYRSGERRAVSPPSSISWRLTGPLARHSAGPTSKRTSRTWARWKSQRRSFSSQEGWVPASPRPELPVAPEIDSAEYRRVDRAEYRDYVLAEYRLVHRCGANSRTHRYSARLQYSLRSCDPPAGIESPSAGETLPERGGSRSSASRDPLTDTNRMSEKLVVYVQYHAPAGQQDRRAPPARPKRPCPGPRSGAGGDPSSLPATPVRPRPSRAGRPWSLPTRGGTCHGASLAG